MNGYKCGFLTINLPVIPAKAGIHAPDRMDADLRRHDRNRDTRATVAMMEIEQD